MIMEAEEQIKLIKHENMNVSLLWKDYVHMHSNICCYYHQFFLLKEFPYVDMQIHECTQYI